MENKTNVYELNIQNNSIPINTSVQMTQKMKLALVFSLITVVPPWLFLLGLSFMALDEGNSIMFLIPFLFFTIPIIVFVIGIFIGKRKNNIIWFFLPHILGYSIYLIFISIKSFNTFRPKTSTTTAYYGNDVRVVKTKTDGKGNSFSVVTVNGIETSYRTKTTDMSIQTDLVSGLTKIIDNSNMKKDPAIQRVTISEPNGSSTIITTEYLLSRSKDRFLGNSKNQITTHNNGRVSKYLWMEDVSGYATSTETDIYNNSTTTRYYKGEVISN